jgi:hypothetical protein
MSNLLLAMLHKVGAPVDAIGDSCGTGRPALSCHKRFTVVAHAPPAGGALR